MMNDNIGYIILIFASIILNSGLLVFTYLKTRGKPGATGYMCLTIAAIIYSLGYALELKSSSLQEAVFWLKIEYIGIPVIPAFCLVMVLDYIGLEKFLSKRWLFAIFFIPMISYILYYTNNFHHLFYSSIVLRSDTPFPLVLIGKGPWYWVQTVYIYLCVLGGIVLLLRFWQKSVHLYRMQIMSMLIGLLIPLLGNLIYLLGGSPWGIDLSPVMMILASPFFAWSLLSFQLFNLLPIARDIVFDSIHDGVLVLDEQDRIVDYNAAAHNIFQELTPASIGQKVQTIFSHCNNLIDDIVLNVGEYDIKLTSGVETAYYHLRISPITRKIGGVIGKALLFSDITVRIHLEEDLQRLATTDYLTGLWNRRHLMLLGNKEFERFRRYGGQFSVIIFDLDSFKSVNDKYSHRAGDSVLIGVTQAVLCELRTVDSFGRFGGEEFTILLPETPLAVSEQVCERLRQLVADTEIKLENGESINITASFGVTQSSTEDRCFEDVLNRADHALYQAKALGRNRIFSKP